MEEEAPDAMNLDLNLGPGPDSESEALPSEGVNLVDWMNEEPMVRVRDAAVRLRARQRWRWRQVQFPHEELNQLIGDPGSLGGLQAGEGSVAAEARTNDEAKMCENGSGYLEDEVSEKKDDVEKGSGTDGSFFDCNICFDLASDPVVTCCGHLFCWACLYRWIHIHSDAKECPVCKGEVTIKNVTPIYGRGNKNLRPPEEDETLEIPSRPQGRRVESLRQTLQRNHLNFPMEEVIRRLGSRLEIMQELAPSQEPNGGGGRDSTDRNSLLNRIMTIRGMRSEQSSILNPNEVVDLTQSGTSSPEGGRARRIHSLRHSSILNPTEVVDLTQTGTSSPDGVRARRIHSLLLRRSQSHSHTHRPSAHTSLSSAFTSTERMVDFLRNNPISRNQDQAVDDRDSFSSIAAVINSESQMDTAVEIDSMVSLSTSSSRRRNDGSRASDVDSGDSRAPRRRRLN
ncbi:E3 ubiquitin-protein ligase RMA3 [Linum perenne]